MAESLQTINPQHWILSNPDKVPDINSQWFNDKYWLNEGRLLGASSGRGSAWMVKSKNNKMMLRHYYRGGLPAKFIKDKYLWTGLNRTRSIKEFRLLQLMKNISLPVPEPIAAQVIKKGFFYEANLLIEYLPNSSTFAQILNEENHEENWQDIGKTIAKFHKQGINHSDLNASNILVGEKIHLIDFDNSTQMKTKRSWQKSNLNRLKRSIDKLTDVEFIDTNMKKWKLLLESYNQKIKT